MIVWTAAGGINMNLQEKFADEHLKYCQLHRNLLNQWEYDFIKDVEYRSLEKLSVKQFNKLKDIADRIKGGN
jgi:hypothetical protein